MRGAVAGECQQRPAFNTSNNMKMSSNEVILIATHTIDLGKAFIDPSNFIFTESA